MRLTKTALRELTKKYRAVLRNCVLALLGIMCVVDNVKADEPPSAYTNAKNTDGYYKGDGTEEIIIAGSNPYEGKELKNGLTSSNHVYGQRISSGDAKNAEVSMYGGTIHSLYGGYLGGSGSVSGNIVNILSGTISYVYGGKSEYGTGAINVSGNIVNISSGTISEVYGGHVYGETDSNTIANNNIVTIIDGNIGSVTGGYSTGTIGSKTIANNNKVTIMDGNIGSVTGGCSTHANGGASGNIVNILGGEIGSVFGGKAAEGGDAIGNIVKISGGTISSNVTGGSSSGTVSNNAVLISGNPEFSGPIYVANGRASRAENNILAISGTPTFFNNNLIGGNGTASSNNTLILNTKVSGIQYVLEFQNYVFVMTNSVSRGETMLFVSNPVDLTDTKVAVGAAKSGVNLNVGDSVVLMKNATGTPTLDNSLFSQTNISKYAYAVNLNYNTAI